MLLLLDISENKAQFIIELLNNFSYVKTKTISPEKALILEELKEAAENLKQVKNGTLKPKLAKELLNEI